jgi:hypothetical protein
VHRRLAPGFVVDAKMDGDARIVTFANGNIARERLHLGWASDLGPKSHRSRRNAEVRSLRPEA